MARMVITGFPDPPANEQWCAICVAFVKGELLRNEDVQQRMADGLADTGKDVFTIAVSAGARNKLILQLDTAVTWTPHPNFGQAVVPVCWTHAAAIDGQATPPGPRAAQGLYRGRLN